MTSPVRLVPYDIDAEEAVAASIVVNPNGLHEVSGYLLPSHFYREKNGWIYAACLALSQQGIEINLISVGHQLLQDERLEKMGGHTYLADLLVRLPTSEMVGYYWAIVKEKAAYRDLIRASHAITNMAYEAPSGTEELQRVLHQAAGLVTQVSNDSFGETEDTTGHYLMSGLADAIVEWMEDPRRLTGLSTGFRKLDQMIDGLGGGRVHVIMAAPKSGKSQIVYNMVLNLAEHGIAPYVASTEMKGEEVTRRLIHLRARVEMHGVRYRGGVTSGERERMNYALDYVNGLPIHIRNTKSLDALDNEIRKAVARDGVRAVFIDHLQHLYVPKLNERETVVAAMARLKEITIREDIPIVLVSHINRFSMDGPLKYNSGASSSAIEKDADCVITLEAVKFNPATRKYELLSREEMDTEDESDKMDVRLRVQLIRHGIPGYELLEMLWEEGGRFVEK